MVSVLRRLRYLAVVVPLLAFTADPSEAQGCRNFELPTLSKGTIYTDYARAVLRLECGAERGTGYLIDSPRGYLLTAFHVVKDCVDIPVTVTHESLVTPLQAIHVANLAADGKDIALLRLEQESALAGITSLDVAFRVPNESAALYTMGYPRGTPKLNKQQVEAVEATNFSTVEVKQAAYPGDSGSPLIDEFGKVVGTATSRLKTVETIEFEVSNRGTYLLTADILPLLRHIEPSKTTRRLSDSLKSGGLPLDQLVQLLVPERASLSNVELFTLVALIADDPQSYQKAAALIPCPILQACSHRRMDQLVFLLLGFSRPANRIEAFFRKGEEAARLGRSQEAVQAFENAADLLNSNELQGEVPSVTVGLLYASLGRARLTNADIPGARSAFERAIKAGGDGATTSQALAGLSRVELRVGNRASAQEYALKSLQALQPEAIVELASQVVSDAPRATVQQQESTIRSGPKPSGRGREFSDWYSVCAQAPPTGFVIDSAEFRLSGDRQCGSWAECRQTVKTDTAACFEFRMQGHDEWPGSGQALSEGVVSARYRPQGPRH